MSTSTTTVARAHLGPQGKRRGRGIRALEDVRQRCVIDDVTGCWLWVGAMAGGTHPTAMWPADGRTRTVRHIVQTLSRREPQPGENVFAREGCSMRCVCPAHLTTMLRKDWGAKVTESGALRDQPKRVAANRARAREVAHLTADQVAEIRASAEPIVDIARRLGVTPNVVGDARRGRTWRETTVAAASVFSWAAAANDPKKARA